MKPQFAEVLTMLRSYSAKLDGSKIIWLDQPPANLVDTRVLVVVDDDAVMPAQVLADTLADAMTTTPIPGRYDLTDLVGRLQWRGDAVAAQRAQRDAW
jgi:hypothetical protein